MNYGYDYSYNYRYDISELNEMAAIFLLIIAFVVFQLFPRQIIGLFGSGSPEYFQFNPTAAHTNTAIVATTAFRFPLALMPFLLHTITDILPR